MSLYTPPYPVKYNPVPTPAERVHILERENRRLEMRVAVLTEALHAVEEELSKRCEGDCELAAVGLVKEGRA